MPNGDLGAPADLISTTRPRQRTAVSSSAIQSMQRCCNSSAGSTTNKATPSKARNMPSTTLSSRSAQVCLLSNIGIHLANIFCQTRTMPKAGTCLADATCRSRNTPRLMRPISRPFIVTAATQPFGVPLVCSTTRSTNTATPSMPTHGRFALIRSSRRSGTTLALW